MSTIISFLVFLSLSVTNGHVEHTMDQLVTCEDGSLRLKVLFEELERNKELHVVQNDHALDHYSVFFDLYLYYYYIKDCDVYWQEEKGYFKKSVQDFRAAFELEQSNRAFGLEGQECAGEAFCPVLSDDSIQIDIDQQTMDIIKEESIAESNESDELLRSIYGALILIDNKDEDYIQMVRDAKHALKLCYSIFGEQHLRTAQSYTKLGWAYREEGSYLKAIKAHTRGIAIYKQLKQYEDMKLPIASAYKELAFDYTKLKEWKRAREATRTRFHIFKQLFGVYDRRTIGAFLELWGSYWTCLIPEDPLLQYYALIGFFVGGFLLGDFLGRIHVRLHRYWRRRREANMH